MDWQRAFPPSPSTWEKLIHSQGLIRITDLETRHRIQKTLPISFSPENSAWFSQDGLWSWVALYGPDQESPLFFGSKDATSKRVPKDPNWQDLGKSWTALAALITRLEKLPVAPPKIETMPARPKKAWVYRDPREIQY